ncbi:MAG: hypothetical protein LC785_17245 [Acidobacteria bacterium]|nr:hypothetical protein [Acidobacteriota bacterium]
MKLIRTAILLSALAPLCIGAMPRGFQFKIYCVDNKVRVESTKFEGKRDASESPICELSSINFPSFAVARRAAKRFGGGGAPCRCTKARPKT